MSFSKISAALVLATVAVTVAIALLLVESQSRNGTFYLSLGFVLLAEVFLFAGPHLVRTGGGTRMAPWHFAMASIPIGYAIGVAVITIAAAWGTPWRVLVSAQLAWLLMLVIALITVRSAGDRIVAGIDTDRAGRASFASVLFLLDEACRRCEQVTGSDAAAISKELRRLREDARYAAQDSLPEAIPIDAELAECFTTMSSSIESLEPDAGNRTTFDEIIRQVKSAHQMLARREDVIAHART